MDVSKLIRIGNYNYFSSCITEVLVMLHLRGETENTGMMKESGRSHPVFWYCREGEGGCWMQTAAAETPLFSAQLRSSIPTAILLWWQRKKSCSDSGQSGPIVTWDGPVMWQNQLTHVVLLRRNYFCSSWQFLREKKYFSQLKKEGVIWISPCLVWPLWAI